MKIKFLGKWKHEGVDYEKDDVKSFDDATGDFFCRAGIGKDMAGKVATSKPKSNEVITLDVQSINQKESVSNG